MTLAAQAQADGNAPAKVRLQLTPAHPKAGDAVEVTATVARRARSSRGAVSLYQDDQLVGLVNTDRNGVASLRLAERPAGQHMLRAVFQAADSGENFASQTVTLTVAAQSAGELASTAFSFTDSVGVVTHLNYDNTPYYTAWPTVLSKLKQAGITHIRDGYGTWPSSSPFIAEHQQLAAAGIHCTTMVPWETHATAAALASYASLVRDVEAFEGPNECDAAGNCGGGGAVGIRNAAAEMPVLAAVGKTLQLPVLGPSFTMAESYAAVGNLSSEVDYSNLHVYYANYAPGTQGWGGGDAEQNRYGGLPFWMDQGQAYAPGAPSVITESGYISTSDPTAGVLPESVEASYVPRTLLGAFNAGIKRTFLYELLDEVSSPGYGLLNADLSEKPSFTALRNLMTLLQDAGGSFTPGRLNYTLTGGRSSLQHLLLQKKNGSFYLILWSEESSFDPTTDTALYVTPQLVSLSATGGPPLQEITQFLPTGDTIKSQAVGSTIRLVLSDQLTVLRFSTEPEVQ